VCEERKVEIVCWGCKCEDFCAPGCSKPGCLHCDEVCASCNAPNGKSGVCCESKTYYWRDWIPWGNGMLLTKKKLMKKVETKKIPVYKWVVEDVCAECELNHPAAVDVPPGATIPPRPALPPAPGVDAPGSAGTNAK